MLNKNYDHFITECAKKHGTFIEYPLGYAAIDCSILELKKLRHRRKLAHSTCYRCAALVDYSTFIYLGPAGHLLSGSRLRDLLLLTYTIR